MSFDDDANNHRGDDDDNTSEFRITHESKLVDFQGESLCCIVDNNTQNQTICKNLSVGGYDYNLKGIIIKNPRGYQLACRYIIKGDDSNLDGYLDYKIAPSNDWITQLRKSKKLAIANSAGVIMMIGQDLWTGDIENVLKRFYSSSTVNDT